MRNTFQFDSSHAHCAPPDSDPLAARLSWAPLRPGGMPFKTCNVALHGGVITVTPSTTLILSSALLIGCGLLMIVQFGPEFFFGAYSFESGIPTLMGQLLVLGGAWLFRYRGMPFKLDKTKGVYVRGGWIVHGQARTDQGSLPDIRAVQIIDERVSGEQTYTSYEINLVCQDGTRINVLDHRDFEAAVAAGALISAYLGIPFWRRNWQHRPIGHPGPATP